MTSLSTRTKIFREQAGAIRALATARREDGKVFLHADILAALGLPTDKSWQRSLSNWLCKDGIRRRPEYTHKRSDAPEIPALIQDEVAQPKYVEAETLLRDVHERMYDCFLAVSDAMKAMEEAVQALYREWERMTAVAGKKPEDYQDADD